jgi:hypothetical protein
MEGFAVKVNESVRAQVFVSNYQRALILAQTLYPKNAVEVVPLLRARLCPGCGEVPVSAEKCSCWGYS